MGKQVAIIDYQLGNMFSVQQACEFLGYSATITTDKNQILSADYAILPGVGAFGDAMQNLHALDLVEVIKDYIAVGKPFMGVCLGLQLLFTESEEFGNFKGLNIVEGTVRKFPGQNKRNEKLKVPQIEWNQIYEPHQKDWQHTPLQNCVDGDYMYFVHSFFVEPQRQDVVLTTTEYGDLKYCSAIQAKNVFACQFHPEKSGEHGVDIYKTWFDLYGK